MTTPYTIELVKQVCARTRQKIIVEYGKVCIKIFYLCTLQVLYVLTQIQHRQREREKKNAISLLSIYGNNYFFSLYFFFVCLIAKSANVQATCCRHNQGHFHCGNSIQILFSERKNKENRWTKRMVMCSEHLLVSCLSPLSEMEFFFIYHPPIKYINLIYL